jgi:hypothetical protein
MSDRCDGLKASIGQQSAIEQALLQSDLLGVSRRSACLLPSDWPRDLRRRRAGSVATARQPSPGGVPSGKDFPELGQAALTTSALPILSSDLLLRHTGKTGRGSQAGHQVHPGEVELIVLGAFVRDTAQLLENILNSLED